MSVLSDTTNAGNDVELVGGTVNGTPSRNWTYLQKVTPEGTNARFAVDRFGEIFDVDGSILAVGTPHHPYDATGDNALTEAGTVWIYHKETNAGIDTWVQKRRLVSPDRAANDRFGNSISISGDTLVIGAPNNSFDANGANQVDQAGAVYVYVLSGGTWSLQQKIIAQGVNGRVQGDSFGTSVNIDGNRLVIGAPNQDYNDTGSSAVTNAGAAFVFERTNGVWSFTKKLVASGSNGRVQGDMFGTKVRVSGSRILVQAPGQDYDSTGANNVSNAGAVFAFKETSGAWAQEARLVSNNRAANANFGNAIDFKDSTAIISTANNATNEIFNVDASGVWTNTRQLSETIANSTTRLLLHFEGADGASTGFVDEASGEPYDGGSLATVITQNNATVPAKLATRQSRFGATSLYLDKVDGYPLATSNRSSGLTIDAKRRPALGTSDFTIEFWFKPEVWKPYNNGPTPTRTYNIMSRANVFSFGIYDNGNFGALGTLSASIRVDGLNRNFGTYAGSVPLSDWNHVALVRYGSVLTLYLNGRIIGTQTILPESTVGDETNDNPIIIGASANGYDGLVGFFDELRIIKEAKYTKSTIAPPAAPFRFKDVPSTAQGRGKAAAIYDANQILIGLPDHSGIDNEIADYIPENIQSTMFSGMNVNGGGLVEIITKVGGVWSVADQLVAAGTANIRQANDQFGSRVIIKDGKILVSAPTHDRDLTGQTKVREAGAAFLYSWDGQSPKFIRKFVSTKRREQAKYGTGVALNDHNIVISAPDYQDINIGFTESVQYGDSLYPSDVYVFRTTTWTYDNGQVETWSESNNAWSVIKTHNPYKGNGQTATVRNSHTSYTVPAWPIPDLASSQNSAFPRYAESVVVSAAGRFAYSNPTKTSNETGWPSLAGGSVQSMIVTGNAWNETAFTVPGTSTARSAGDQFGLSVATNGTTVSVGSPGNSVNLQGEDFVLRSGAVFSYKKNTNSGLWDMEQKILSQDRVANAAFGYSVAQRGTRLLATNYNNATGGASYLYDRGTETPWVYKSTHTQSSITNAQFISDNAFLSGNPFVDATAAADAGAAKLTNIGGADQTFVPPGGMNGRIANDQFGYSVSLENNLIAIGAPNHSYNKDGAALTGATGAVNLYEFSNDYGRWLYSTKVNAGGAGGNGRFGSSVDLNSGYLVVGNEANSLKMQTFIQNAPGNWSYQGESTSGYNISKSVVLLNSSLAIGGMPTLTVRGETNVGGFNWMTRASTAWTGGAAAPEQIMYVPTSTNTRWSSNTMDYTLLSINGRKANDAFGTSVAISDDKGLIAIGSPNHAYSDVIAGAVTGAGAAYVYSLDNVSTKYVYQGKITRTGSATTNTALGSSVAFKGNYLAIGGSTHSSFKGLAQVHLANGSGITGSWNLQGEFVGVANNDMLGKSVAFSTNDRVALAIPGLDANASAMNTGGVNWATRTGTTWSALQGNIQVPGINNGRIAGDTFGTSVVVDGDRIAIGAPRHIFNPTGQQSVSPTHNGGAIFTYTWTGSSWIQEQKVVFGKSGTTLGFGTALDVKGDTMSVGFPAFATNYTFKLVDNVWVSTGSQAQQQANDGVGSSVAVIETDKIAIGFPTLDSAAAVDTGGARVYELLDEETKLWSATASFYQPSVKADGTVIMPGYTAGIKSGDNFGTSVSLSSNYLAIGAPGKEFGIDGSVAATNTGAVYLYAWKPDLAKYVFDAQILHPDNSDSEKFGTSVELKDSTLIAGGHNSSTYSNGVSRRGSFYVFSRTGEGSWSKQFSNYSNQQDGTGLSVTLVQPDVAVAGLPYSAGAYDDFQITNSGTFRYVNKHDGVWTFGDIMAGGDGGIAGTSLNTNTSYQGAGAGGGAGARGGAGGAAPFAISTGDRPGQPGQGGTNLAPVGGQALAGSGRNPGNSADADRGTAGLGGQAVGGTTVGQHARVVLSWGANKQVFNYTGADQEFIVPSGVTSLTVKLWGAGGGAGGQTLTDFRSGGDGGGGGYVSGTIEVTPDESLKIMVGQGGTAGLGGTARPGPSEYGLGGRGGTWASGAYGGSGGNGGGLAAIFRDTTALAIAGGGGGGGGGENVIDSTNSRQGVPGGVQNAASANVRTQLVAGYANGRASDDTFGYSVALGEGYAAIGAPGHSFNLAGQSIGSKAGAVFLYRRAGQTWEYKGKINMQAPKANTFFGSAITITPERMAVMASIRRVVSAVNNTPAIGGGYTGAGSVEVLKKTDADVWQTEYRIDGTATENGFYNYGVGMMSDASLIIGAPMSNNATNEVKLTGAGSFQTYNREDDTWTKVSANVTQGLSHGRFASDAFGTKVKVGNGFVAISAPGHDYSENGVRNISNMGGVFIFRKEPSGAWAYETKLSSPSNITAFGQNLSLVGSTVHASGTNAQQVWTRNGVANWTAHNVLTSTGAVPATLISDTSLVSGNPADSAGVDLQPTITNAGSIQVYNTTDNATWSVGTRMTIPGLSNGRNASDEFGHDVAISSAGYIAVTARAHMFNEAGNSRVTRGAVYIYNQPPGGKWKFERKLTTSINTSNVWSAANVEADGNYLLVSDSKGSITSMAELMRRNSPGSWSVVNTIAPAASDDNYAFTMVSPDMLVIGKPANNGALKPGAALLGGAGAVRTITNSGGTWTERQALIAPGAANSRMAGDHFASAVGMTRDFVILGAPDHSFNRDGTTAATNAGAVWLFQRLGNTFEMVNMYTAPVEFRTNGARFGASVAMSSDNQFIAVGAPAINKVFLYTLDSGELILAHTFEPEGTFASGDKFGYAISVNKGRLVIGAPGHALDTEDANSMANAGAVYAYKLVGKDWVFTEKFVGFSNDKVYNETDQPENQFNTSGPNGRAIADKLGSSVAVSTHRALITGGPTHDYDQLGGDLKNDAGAAWIKYLR